MRSKIELHSRLTLALRNGGKRRRQLQFLSRAFVRESNIVLQLVRPYDRDLFLLWKTLSPKNFKRLIFELEKVDFFGLSAAYFLFWTHF